MAIAYFEEDGSGTLFDIHYRCIDPCAQDGDVEQGEYWPAYSFPEENVRCEVCGLVINESFIPVDNGTD